MTQINLASQFSEYPAGRYRTDGNQSGQAFREDYLVPNLQKHEKIVVVLDGAMGYGSSFLEEAFGGLVREHGFTARELRQKLEIVSVEDPALIDEIWEYIEEQE